MEEEKKSKRGVLTIAVIGAGGAGLCALRVLNGHSSNWTTFTATAFEMSDNVGGSWVYTDTVGTDQKDGLPVHSSMYKNLRTNTPKECMAYPDFPYPSHLSSFVRHQDVRKYLEDYATHFDLWKLIKFQTLVEHVTPVPDNSARFGVRWKVSTASVTNREDRQTDIFDAVLVCNGHFSRPLVPEIPGLHDVFEGDVIHSHDYRIPQPYTDKRVVVLGGMLSGQDIGLDVSRVAAQVYLCHNKPRLPTSLPPNIEQRPGIKLCHKNAVELLDGTFIEADDIILCTGYQYKFDFLDKSIGVKVEDGRVTPLYKHFLTIGYPSLGLVGILNAVLSFPMFYIQAKYFRSVLDGSASVPSQKEMLQEEQEEFHSLLSQGVPARHVQTVFDRMFDYFRNLADLGHFNPLPSTYEGIYYSYCLHRARDVTTYKNTNYVLTDHEEKGFQVYCKPDCLSCHSIS